MSPDEALVRAWALAIEDITDAVEDEFERLLPMLIKAGYVATEGDTWHFTPKGVERAKLLSGE